MGGRGSGGDGAIYSSIDGSGDAYPIGDCDTASRVIKYVVVLGYRHSHYNLVDMRIHDINVEADLNAHDPNASNPEDLVEFDGTPEGYSEGATDGTKDANNAEQLAIDSLTAEWLGPWPALLLTATMDIGTFSFIIQMVVDILGSLTLYSMSLVADALTSMSDQEMEQGLGTVLQLSIIQSLSLIVLVSYVSAQFFATFGKLPEAQVLFAASLVIYIASAIALLVAIAQAYHDGTIRAIDAAMAIISLGATITFGGQTLGSNTYFRRLFSCLDKYETAKPDKWGFHDCFFTYSKLLVLLVAVAIGLGILLG